MAVNARGMMPGFLCSLSPTMVKVFPEPVWPYAKMHTLKPSMADWMSLQEIYTHRVNSHDNHRNAGKKIHNQLRWIDGLSIQKLLHLNSVNQIQP